MLLKVEFERFIEEVKKRIPGETVYVERRDGRTVLTARCKTEAIVLFCSDRRSKPELCRLLEEQGIATAAGAWVESEVATNIAPPAFIAAVAYRSRDAKPGLWVDGFPAEPSLGEVLTTLYEEFTATGDLGDVSFEQFTRLASPNVVILSPDEVARFMDKKLNPC